MECIHVYVRPEETRRGTGGHLPMSQLLITQEDPYEDDTTPTGVVSVKCRLVLLFRDCAVAHSAFKRPLTITFRL